MTIPAAQDPSLGFVSGYHVCAFYSSSRNVLDDIVVDYITKGLQGGSKVFCACHRQSALPGRTASRIADARQPSTVGPGADGVAAGSQPAGVVGQFRAQPVAHPGPDVYSGPGHAARHHGGSVYRRFPHRRSLAPQQVGDYFEQAPEDVGRLLAGLTEAARLDVKGSAACWAFPISSPFSRRAGLPDRHRQRGPVGPGDLPLVGPRAAVRHRHCEPGVDRGGTRAAQADCRAEREVEATVLTLARRMEITVA